MEWEGERWFQNGSDVESLAIRKVGCVDCEKLVKAREII